MSELRRFTLGEWYEATPDKTDYGLFEKMCAEVDVALNKSDGHLPGHLPFRVIEKDGLFYTAHCYSGQWERFYDLYRGRHDALPVPADGAKMCECGNKSFHIHYGSYECFGTCTACSITELLYSG